MKKHFIYLACIGGVLLTQSCDNTTQKVEETKSTVSLDANDSLFHIQESGYNFYMALPKDLMINDSPEIKVNSSTGELHIQLGERFWVIVTQDKNDMATLKKDMQEDMLFKHEIIEENPTAILCKRVLPDGTEYDYSFVSTNELSGVAHVFRTSQEGEFSLENVTRMKKAIGTIRASV